MLAAYYKFFRELNHTMNLYEYAISLHKKGFLPCQPGFVLNQHRQITLSCHWSGRPPRLLREIPATALLRGAYVAYRHQTVLGLTRHGGKPAFPYTWVIVNKNPPVEYVGVWQRYSATGAWVPLDFSVANTGVDHSTPDGSWPIFMRRKSGRMKGVTPTGIRYDDANVHWINYFHRNIAVHGFRRARYGFPQSAGCVELPLAAAKAVFGMVHDGTIVTVTGHWSPRPERRNRHARKQKINGDSGL